MIDIIISLIPYTLFGLIGILLFKRINFTKNIFNKKQSAIYLSIYYIVFGFF
jgi:Na+/melibiose symporter-like transporter